MAKYKDYGRKILAVLLTIATVLTTSSIDFKALAAEYGGVGDTTGYTISPGGYLGEIITNTGSGGTPNQKVLSASFNMVQLAGVPYNYIAYIYENPTIEGDPTS